MFLRLTWGRLQAVASGTRGNLLAVLAVDGVALEVGAAAARLLCQRILHALHETFTCRWEGGEVGVSVCGRSHTQLKTTALTFITVFLLQTLLTATVVGLVFTTMAFVTSRLVRLVAVRKHEGA